ncbi:hypothetical protein Btru_024120 [Bulinus truncatus]|nr:hypothetical protein Btru_024120 [Bulinus truncatus]
MVLVSSVVAMQNPRSHVIVPPMRRPHDQQPEFDHRGKYAGHPVPGTSSSRPLSAHTYSSDVSEYKSREHVGRSLGRAFPGPSANSSPGSSQDAPQVDPMPHTLKSASTSSVVASRPDMMMVNGFIVHSKPTTAHRAARHNDLHHNGEVIVGNHSSDTFLRNSLKSASFTHFPTHTLHQEMPTLLDLTQHKAKAVYISPTCPDRLNYSDQKDSTDYGTLRPHSKGHSVKVSSTNVISSDYQSQEMISDSGTRSQHRTLDSQSNYVYQNTRSPNYTSANYLPNDAEKIGSSILQRPRGQFDSKIHVSNSGTGSAAHGGMVPSKGALVYKGLAPRNNANQERLDYGTRFSSMQCLHERTNTYKPNLKSVSSYSIRDDHQSPIAHHSGRASTGTNDYLQNGTLSSTLQRRGSDQLRRAVSYEQSGLEPKPYISRTSSDGEIESDYVTLDRRYLPFQSPRLSRVTEGVAPSSPLTDSNTAQIDSSTHASNLDPINSNVVVHANFNPIRSSKSMNTIRTTNTPDSGSDSYQKRKINTGALRVVAETIGSVFHSPRSSGSSSKGSGSPRSINSFGGAPMTFGAVNVTNGDKNPKRMTRSKSLSDLRAPDGLTHYSDDEDGDDFGFLSYPISFTSPSSASAAMNKAKSPSPGNRIFPKRWRSKTKAVPTTATAATMWMPGPPKQEDSMLLWDLYLVLLNVILAIVLKLEKRAAA